MGTPPEPPANRNHWELTITTGRPLESGFNLWKASGNHLNPMGWSPGRIGNLVEPPPEGGQKALKTNQKDQKAKNSRMPSKPLESHPNPAITQKRWALGTGREAPGHWALSLRNARNVLCFSRRFRITSLRTSTTKFRTGLRRASATGKCSLVSVAAAISLTFAVKCLQSLV